MRNKKTDAVKLRTPPSALRNAPAALRTSAGFTMIEIAICLAIIGFALVAIIGVLPLGMHTQRDVREATIINQDATVLLEAIRTGARGADDLTNHVYQIVNFWGQFDATGTEIGLGSNVFNYTGSTFYNSSWPLNQSNLPLTNGASIIGLMSMPEYMNASGSVLPNLFNGGYSNHITAYVRSISGLAAEQPPQDNSIMVNGTFTYHVYCVNASAASLSSAVGNNLHELRLTFLWPQLPNGNLPQSPSYQTFRATVAGQLAADPTNNNLHFYQPQSFQ
jgi:prepilin-type N-terminal cleavage/methylation domain-containing protein